MPLSERIRPLLLPVLFSIALSCGHSEPFQDPDETNQGPFSPAAPIQLTYNPGPDLTPAFVPGDTLVLYSYQSAGNLSFNQCIGALPAGGGTAVSQSCPRSAASLDSTERYENPVPLDDSTIVLVQSARLKGAGVDAVNMIGTAPWRSADQFTPRFVFPFPTPGGVHEVSASYLSLLGGGLLAYVAVVDVSACPGTDPFCDSPTLLRIGREIAQLDLAATGDPVVLPGTDYATSASSGRTPEAVLFTLPFDTRVYERQTDGSTIIVRDFAPEVPRDPVVVGNLMVVVTGGDISRWTSNDGVPLQVDGGGDLTIVNLASAQTAVIPGSYSHPALSADGRIITAVSGADLYRIDLQ